MQVFPRREKSDANPQGCREGELGVARLPQIERATTGVADGNGEIYLAAGAVGSAYDLDAIDPGTGVVESARPISVGGTSFTGAVPGLSFGNGRLDLGAGEVGSAFDLDGIDPQTGASNSESLIVGSGRPFTGAMAGLASVPAVPEPGSPVLSGLGGRLIAASATRAPRRNGIGRST